MGMCDRPRGHGAVRTRALLLAVVGAACLCMLGIAGARAGDPELAQTLMQAGKKALEEGDLDRAYSAFQKAHEESDQLFECLYWQGVVSEKRGDVPNAIGLYQAFLKNFDAVGRGGLSAPPVTVPLAKRARARLEVIAPGPCEREKLEDAFVVKMLEVAKAARKASPEAAKRAARWVTHVRPGHEPALALLAELGDVAAAGAANDPATEPFADVPEVRGGKSLLQPETFGKLAGWSWAKADGRWIATVDMPAQGQVHWPHTAFATGPRFVYELEVRILTEHQLNWAIGPAFGKYNDFVMVMFQRGQVVASRGGPSGKFVDIGGNGLKAPLDLKVWQRLTYVVDGTKLHVWLNGMKMLEKDVPFAPEIAGDLGLWLQLCKVEVRSLRYGALP